MSSSSASLDVTSDVLDQAIAWVVRSRSGMLDEAAQRSLQQEIQMWRQEAPAHEAAWQELQAVEQGFVAVQETQRMHAARTLQTIAFHRGARQSRRKALRVLGWGGFSVALGSLTIAQPEVRSWTASLTADYTTETGERRNVVLSDGTRIALNTDTAIDVRYTATQREIVLYRGEIFIQTAKDTNSLAGHRRFIVQSRAIRLEALGTQFFVKQESDRARLQVTEGRVAIRRGDVVTDVVAHAGQAYRIDDDGSATLLEEMSDSSAWLDGVLIAKQMRLGDVVVQLARYRKGWLRCDPAIADFQVSGVFQLDDTDSALEVLVQALPISLVRHTRYWVTLHPA